MEIESVIRWLGGLLAYTMWGIMLYGIWRGTQRQAGLTSGRSGAWLRSPWFYLVTSAIFFGVCYLAWIPLPVTLSTQFRSGFLVLGSLLYFPGMLFALWGRLALGREYFVSTGFGAQLFAGHQLVTSGPYAILRHPIYAGLILAAIGGLLIYLTWTMLVMACSAPLLMVRAWREEAALAVEFGEQWRTYCNRVHPLFPRFNQ